MRLVLTADDTTGALETAAGCADVGWATVVVPRGRVAEVVHDAGVDAVVVDLRSRHVTDDEATARLEAVLAVTSVDAHKVDSTLRGNWPAEVAALRRAGCVVVMVPAYPAAGRRCVGGVVLEHGVAVDQSAHAADPRAPVRTARPATLLPGAVELGEGAVAGWLAEARGGDAAVVDAGDDAAVVAAVDAVLSVDRDDVVVVGTAGVLGELARRVGPGADHLGSATDVVLERPVLVVAGSAHPVARAQVEAVRAAALRQVHVLAAPPVRRDDPAALVRELAAEARRSIELLAVATVVVVGGDTAEAVIGEAMVRVVGSLGVGIAAGRAELGGRVVVLVSKPGAFGDADTVTTLLGATPGDGMPGHAGSTGGT
jgi:uncharacterized protein YgbK (DUF1537 family)